MLPLRLRLRLLLLRLLLLLRSLSLSPPREESRLNTPLRPLRLSLMLPLMLLTNRSLPSTNSSLSLWPTAHGLLSRPLLLLDRFTLGDLRLPKDGRGVPVERSGLGLLLPLRAPLLLLLLLLEDDEPELPVSDENGDGFFAMSFFRYFAFSSSSSITVAHLLSLTAPAAGGRFSVRFARDLKLKPPPPLLLLELELLLLLLLLLLGLSSSLLLLSLSLLLDAALLLDARSGLGLGLRFASGVFCR